jgi:hypothetical protein
VGIWHSLADKLKAEIRWSEGTADSVILSLAEADAQARSFINPDADIALKKASQEDLRLQPAILQPAQRLSGN